MDGFSEDGSIELPDGFEDDTYGHSLTAEEVARKDGLVANRRLYLEKEMLLKELAELKRAAAVAGVAVAGSVGIEDG